MLNNYLIANDFVPLSLTLKNKMNKGTVKFFNDTKGFGFISEEGTNKDYFVHVSGLNDEIREGDEVEFDLEEGKKGLNAVNVSIV